MRLILYFFLFSYILIGLGEIGLSYMLGMNREVLGAAFLVPPLLSLVLWRRGSVADDGPPGMSPLSMKASISVWLVLCTAAVVAARVETADYHLPLLFFLLIGAVATTIALQILLSASTSSSQHIVLFEIICTALLLTLSFQYLFPGPIGNDSTYHLGLIDQILDSGYIGYYPGQYTTYPIYHIFLSEIEMLTGASDKLAFAIMSLSIIPFLLAVFKIADRLFDRRVALLATMLAAFAPHIVQAWFMYYPNCFSIVFFIICLSLCFHDGNSKAVKGLIALVFLVMVLTHPLTPAIMVFYLLLLLLASKFVVKVKMNITGWMIGLMIAVTMVQWMSSESSGGSLFDTLITSLRGVLEGDFRESVSGTTTTSLYSPMDVLLYDMGLMLLLAIGILGAMVLQWRIAQGPLHHQPRELQRSLVVAILALCVVPVPYALAAVYPGSQPDRWFPFTEAVVCMVAGYCIMTIMGKGRRRGRAVIAAGATFLLVFFMISTPVANVNNDIYSGNMTTRDALTAAEESGRLFIIDNGVQDLHASGNYMQFINRTLINIKDYYDYTYQRYLVNPKDPETYTNGSVALRPYDLTKGFSIALYGSGGKLIETNFPNPAFNNTISSKGHIYASPYVDIYQGEVMS